MKRLKKISLLLLSLLILIAISLFGYTKYKKPVYHELRRYNRKKLEFIDSEVEKMLLLGVIEPYLGDWSSAIVVAPKPGPG